MSQPLPHNENAERYILGGVLIDNEILLQTLDKLNPEDFYYTSHRIFYATMETLYDAGVPITTTTLIDEIKSARTYKEDFVKDLNTIIQGFSSGIPKSEDINYYIKVIKQAATDRTKLKLNIDLSDALYNNDRVAVSDLESQLYDLSIHGQSDIGLSPLGDSVGTGVLESAYKVGKTGAKLIGLPTGLWKLDNITAGLNKKELTILAARPSLGKTALSLNISLYLAKQAKKIAFFSLEMSKEMLYMRLIASEARVDLSKLKTGTLSGVEWARVIAAHDTLSNASLLIDDDSTLTPRILDTKLKKALKRYGQIDMVVIDYLQLMESNNRKENRQQEVSEISRQIREIGRRHNTHIFALSQLSRAPETRGSNMHRPQSSDLRDSGAIEQEADLVLMLYREELYNPNAFKGSAELIMTKSRNSDIAVINLFYVKPQTRFENVFIT